MQKGEINELRITKEARWRFTCGLNWDPIETAPGLGEALRARGRNVSSYDLDLMCLMYNEEGEFVDGVSGKPDETADQSGKVYHSGDDTTGHGDAFDDEQVSVELLDLPDYIHHIVFVAEIQSAHTFADVINPEIHIQDSMSSCDLLSQKLGDGGENTACVFARVFRREGTWMLHYIGDYLNGSEIEDWTIALQKYLD